MPEIREVSVEEYKILKAKYGLGDDMMEKIVGVRPMFDGRKWADAIKDDKLEGVEVLNIEEPSPAIKVPEVKVADVPEVKVAEAEVVPEPSPVIEVAEVPSFVIPQENFLEPSPVIEVAEVPSFVIPQENFLEPSPVIEVAEVPSFVIPQENFLEPSPVIEVAEVKVADVPIFSIPEVNSSPIESAKVEIAVSKTPQDRIKEAILSRVGAVNVEVKDVVENTIKDEPVIENEVVFVAPPMGEDEPVIENEVVFVAPSSEDEPVIENEVVFVAPSSEDEPVIENEVVFVAPSMGEDEIKEEKSTEGISNSRSEMFIIGVDKLKSMFPVKSTINRDVGRVF